MWCTVSWTCLQTIRSVQTHTHAQIPHLKEFKFTDCIFYDSNNAIYFLFRFSPDTLNSIVLPSLKASLDLAAECLILTDVQRKVSLYQHCTFYTYQSPTTVNILTNMKILLSVVCWSFWPILLYEWGTVRNVLLLLILMLRPSSLSLPPPSPCLPGSVWLCLGAVCDGAASGPRERPC